MVLKREDIAVLEANWGDKPAALQRIARELEFGLDALVFFDDNPAERGAGPADAFRQWPCRRCRRAPRAMSTASPTPAGSKRSPSPTRMRCAQATMRPAGAGAKSWRRPPTWRPSSTGSRWSCRSAG